MPAYRLFIRQFACLVLPVCPPIHLSVCARLPAYNNRGLLPSPPDFLAFSLFASVCLPTANRPRQTLLTHVPYSTAQNNGTRLIIRKLLDKVIIVEIATGTHTGSTMVLHRIKLEAPPRDTGFPVALYRLQFPIRPAMALTIHKSQGQTLTRVGVYLPSSVFTHGQLYVAFSRVTRASGLTVAVRGGRWIEGNDEHVPPGTYTDNIVCRELIQL